ncbi:MAG TPA: pirin family protein [Gammaproteobacteria bacterium]|nr:pirin family protein [Gammaproteobacteria bacterium]HPQ25097.1 pirin family protein [Gammaproteobacteria bacterium]
MQQSANNSHPDIRRVSRVVRGMPATDGAGVELTRVIGQPALPMLDPFLLLDAFRSDRPGDYIAGFPQHPHRGFETVTYLLAGRMRHEDSAGHQGVIEPGGIQWMTAGRGIVHSEMPQQQAGLLEGFQLWVNLPAQHKMDAPAYQEHPVDAIPVEVRAGGIRVKVIAGVTQTGTRGPVVQPLTEPLYLDVELPPGQVFSERLPSAHNGFCYVIEGQVEAEDADGGVVMLQRDDLAVLSHGNSVELRSGDLGARCLLIAGRPLNEPVARGGPFVMNTKAEIRQAYDDYAAGLF